MQAKSRTSFSRWRGGDGWNKGTFSSMGASSTGFPPILILGSRLAIEGSEFACTKAGEVGDYLECRIGFELFHTVCGGECDAGAAGAVRCLDAGGGVLKYEAVAGGKSQSLGGHEEYVGCGLAAPDIGAGDDSLPA